MQKIPTFLHIPKNAGTYILHLNHASLCEYLRTHFVGHNFYKKLENQSSRISNLCCRRLLVDIPNSTLLTIFCYMPENIYKNTVIHELDPHVSILSYDQLIAIINNQDVFIFSIMIEPGYYWGSSIYKTNLGESFLAAENICDLINCHPWYYTIFRPILDRAQSIYNYLTSDSSSHEPNHKCITSNTFEKYVESHEFETNWITSSLAPEEINEESFESVSALFDGFKIYDIDHINTCTDETFLTCYNLSTRQLHNNNYNKNSSVIKTKQMNTQIQQTILSKNYWDYRLYKKFIK